MTSLKFERLKQEALTSGVLDRDLLRCLLSRLIPSDVTAPAIEVMTLLAFGFELGYPVSRKHRDSPLSLSADLDSEGKVKVNKLLIPWLRKNDEPEDFTALWESTKRNRKLINYFRFPHFFPPGLFEMVTVRAHAGRHKLHFRHHWGGGVHARHEKEAVHVVISYFREEEEEEGEEEGVSGVWMKYEVRDGLGVEEEKGGQEEGEKEGEATPAAVMWGVMLPLLMEFEELIGSYAGV